MGLLSREYDLWCRQLKELLPKAHGYTKQQLSEAIAHTLEGKDVLLRILNMNLFEIELNSRVERLAEFKKLYLRSVTALSAVLRTYQPEVSDIECEDFCDSFCALLFGIYPFAFHTDKQKEAMSLAGVAFREPTVYQMVYKSLLRLISDK